MIDHSDHLNSAARTCQELREVCQWQSWPKHWLPVQVKHFAHISYECFISLLRMSDIVNGITREVDCV